MYKTPIAFIIYNRPEITQITFGAIRKIKPKQLFIIADGPKNKQDKIKTNQARSITESIDWDCDLKINFSDVNLGCSDRIISGLNWVFDQVDRTIVLEDDCLPDLSFFTFCDELLEQYKYDNQIMHISGFNVMGSSPINESYFFSKYVLPPWGWATWKRAWELNNPNLDTWQEIKHWAYQNISQEYFKDWTDMFENIRVNKTTWDVPWNTDVWKNNGLSIIPQKSLVQNIGFGEDATFTKNKKTKLAEIKAQFFINPMIHPDNKTTNFDSLIEKTFVESLRMNAN